jgi:peptidoglycan/xylan/chitin deacetylase (PgdA/CDA1 family)
MGGISAFAIGTEDSSERRSAPIWDGTLRRIRVPILMYHYVRPLYPEDDLIKRGLTVEPYLFRAHLDYLKEQGYSTISLYELDQALLSGSALPRRPLILTFDDGYLDHYATVFPELREHGFVGTFFVITELADANRSGYLNWLQIQEMAVAGMRMEPHTKTHMELPGRSHDAIVYEVLGSIESLQAYTGIRPHLFAYPVGRYDGSVLEVVAQADVWRAVTTQKGTWHTTDNRLEMPRLRIVGNLSVAGFVALLSEN